MLPDQLPYSAKVALEKEASYPLNPIGKWGREAIQQEA